jgi:hypothetical protein
MKFLTYGLMLIVSVLIVIGAVAEYLSRYFPVAIKLIQTNVKKLYSHFNQKTNGYSKKPTYSY